MIIEPKMLIDLKPYLYQYNEMVKDKTSYIYRTSTNKIPKDTINKDWDAFINNYGEVSDGSFQSIHPSEINTEFKDYNIDIKYNSIFFRTIFNVDLNVRNKIYKKTVNGVEIEEFVNEKIKKRILPMFSLSSSGYSYIQCYANGVKIPDIELLVYLSNSYIDVFVDRNYLRYDSDNIIMIETIKNNDYYTKYFKNYSSNTEFVLDNFELTDINKTHVLIFLNGKLLPNKTESGADLISSFSIDSNNKTFNFFTDYSIEGNIEVCINKKLEVSNTDYYTGELKKCFFYYNENKINPIFGPVSELSSQFFLNGLRIPNVDTIQDGRSHFSYDVSNELFPNGITEGGSIESIYSLDSDNDIKYEIYDDDYFLYNFLGTKKASNLAIDPNYETNTIFDYLPVNSANRESFYDKLFHKESLEYNKKNIEFIDSYYHLDNRLTNATQETIKNELVDMIKTKENPQLVKPFIENFSKDSIVSNESYDKSKGTTITINGVNNLKDKDNVIYFVFVNGKLEISGNSYINSGNIASLDSFTISDKYLIEGTNNNHIEVLWYKLSNSSSVPEHYEIKPSDFSINSDNNYEISFSSKFHNYKDANDFVLLEKVNKSDGYITAESKTYGYRPLDETKYSIDVNTHNNIIKVIVFNSKPVKNLRIYNKHFILEKKLTFPSSIPFEGATISVDDDFDYPIYNRGDLIITAENEILHEGIDFLWRNYDSSDKLSFSAISFTKPLGTSQEIKLYFIPIKNKIILYKDIIQTDNKYAVLSLNNLDIPFSSEYIDIYNRGKKLVKEDIDILSNNLIRLKNEKVPLIDITIKTNFKYDYYKDSDLDKLFKSIYTKSQFEIYLSEKFQTFDYSQSDRKDIDTANKILEDLFNIAKKDILIVNIEDSEKPIIRVNPFLSNFLMRVSENRASPRLNREFSFDDDTLEFLKLFDIDPYDDSIIVRINSETTNLHNKFRLIGANGYKEDATTNKLGAVLARAMEYSNNINNTIQIEDIPRYQDIINEKKKITLNGVEYEKTFVNGVDLMNALLDEKILNPHHPINSDERYIRVILGRR